MSYKRREARRRRKLEGDAKIRGAQRQFNAETGKRYFLTVVQHDGRCSACGGKLRTGSEMVYRKNGSVKLCVPCADKDPLVSYRPSARWEARR